MVHLVIDKEQLHSLEILLDLVLHQRIHLLDNKEQEHLHNRVVKVIPLQEHQHRVEAPPRHKVEVVIPRQRQEVILLLHIAVDHHLVDHQEADLMAAVVIVVAAEDNF